MTDFRFFVELGLKHVLDFDAYDHMLFLIILSLPYTFKTWRKLLLLVTLFTLGHTVSLIISSYGLVSVNTQLIECLIPVTIFIGALFHLITNRNKLETHSSGLLYVITTAFGLIHGFGFATYYKMINEEKEILPLLEFALGVELAQVIIAAALLIITFVFLKIFKVPQRIYILIFAAIVLLITIPMLNSSCLSLF